MKKLFDTEKHNDLIYDVGLHKGEDSEFYMKKGFRVIAFEADPDLAQSCREKLRNYIECGKLTIIEGAITDPQLIVSGKEKITFYKNEKTSVWGTICEDWVERNKGLGSPVTHPIEVDVIDFEEVIREHGIPYYLKIDIEGADLFCLEVLQNFQERPDYVSIESGKISMKQISNEIRLFAQLGYDAFQAVEQSSISVVQCPPDPPQEGGYVSERFEFGSSGLFGRELPGQWKSYHQILRQYRPIMLGYFLVGNNGFLKRKKTFLPRLLSKLVVKVLSRITGAACPGWYDTHARHSSVDTR